MNLQFDDEQMIVMQEEFNVLLPDSLTMTQYELADATGIPANEWTKFLQDGQVQKAIDVESSLIAKANMRKLIDGAADNDRSVGAAQMINAMAKVDTGEQAENHFFIYSFVPLTPAQEKAPHVRQAEAQPANMSTKVETAVEQELAEIDEEAVPVNVPEKVENKQAVTEEDW